MADARIWLQNFVLNSLVPGWPLALIPIALGCGVLIWNRWKSWPSGLGAYALTMGLAWLGCSVAPLVSFLVFGLAAVLPLLALAVGVGLLVYEKPTPRRKAVGVYLTLLGGTWTAAWAFVALAIGFGPD